MTLGMKWSEAKRAARSGAVESNAGGTTSVTIPSDITVMMDTDLRRHHEESGAWSKKGVRCTKAGKRKRRTEHDTTAKPGGNKIRRQMCQSRVGGSWHLQSD